MSFRDNLKLNIAAVEVDKLRFCDLVVLENCMLSCKMCQMWKCSKDANEVPIEYWKRFINSLEQVASSDLQIQFVGGEPLLKEGIFELIKLAAQKGFQTTMTTNAFLIDKKMAREISNSGLNSLVFSLGSLKEDTHDYLRGVKGVYRKLMNAIVYLCKFRRQNLRLHIVTTIMQPNLDDILELAEWVNKDARLEHISFQAVMQPFFTPLNDEWYEDPEFSFLWPKDKTKVDVVLDRLIKLKQKGYKIGNPVAQFFAFKSYFMNPKGFIKEKSCNLGYDSISVNSSGQIFLCSLLQPIGNIMDDNIGELWFSEKAFLVRQQIKNCRRNCKSIINCFFEEELNLFKMQE